MTSILYASGMNIETQHTDQKPGSNLTQGLGNPLFRFMIAGLIAVVITFALLYLMRFLIMGYDKSATEAISQYFTLRTVNLSDDEEERRVRVERPGDRPEFSGLEEPDFKQESAAFLDEHGIDPPLVLSPQQEIETEIQLPQLEATPVSTQEKLQLIKQGILSEED